jgi:hypothetical protein
MGHSANMTINNFSPYDIQVAVVRKHCIYPQTPDGPTGIDAFNTRLTPQMPSVSGNIENKSNSSGGDLCATDTGYFELSFTAMKGEVPDPRFKPSALTVAIPHEHFEKGDTNSNGVVKVGLTIKGGDSDVITIALQDNV